MEITETQTRILDKAKVTLMLDKNTVFYSVLLLSLNPHYSSECQTAATDGFSIMINPEFFNSLTPEERVFLLVHEAMHVALGHICRKGTRDHRLWNIAADYVINLTLHERGFAVPKMALLDVKYRDMSSEQVYNDLMQDEKKNKDKKPDYDDIKSDQSSKETNEEIEKNIDEILRSAAIQTETHGSSADQIPKEIRKYLDSLVSPKLPWKVILSRFLTQVTKEDYSWKRPNRKYYPDYYLPSLYSNTLSRIDIAIDVSGSISQKQFTQFISELYLVTAQFSISEIGVIQFDHMVQQHNIIKRQIDMANIKFKGGGGTDMSMPMNWFIQKCKTSKALIVLTDGYFGDNYKNPGRPVIWAVYGNKDFKPRFGKVIHFKLK